MAMMWRILQFVHDSIFTTGPRQPLYVEDAKQPDFSFGSFLKAMRPSNITLDPFLHGFANEWRILDSSFTFLDSDLGERIKMLKLAQSTNALDLESGFRQRLLNRSQILTKDYFFSLDGKLGICSNGARAGDLVVALYGSNLPLISRRKPTDLNMSLAEILQQTPKYELIGPCYLDGAMYGERMEHHSWSDILHADPLDADPLDPTCEYACKGVYQTKVFHIE